MTKSINIWSYILLTVLVSVFAMGMSAQNEVLKLKCNLNDEATLKKLDNVQIQVFQNGSQFDSYDAGTSGKYEVILPLGFNYDIKFSRTDYVPKILRFDTRNIPQEDKAGGFQSDLVINLFPMIEGFDLDIMKEPVGKSSFDSQKNTMEFDAAYIKTMNDKIKAEKKRLASLSKDEDKFKQEYAKLMAEGETAMSGKKYQDAMGKFEGALKIFPKDEPAKKKYDEAKSKYDAELAAKQADANYNKLMADGEDNIKAKKWDDAKKNFQDAVKLKPLESLPKEKLYEIDQLIKYEKVKVQYDQIIKDADTKFGNKDYAVSIDRYKEASKLLPNESYPKDQIVKAQSIMDMMLADESKRKQIEQDYKDKITLGDRNFKDKSYDIALSNYREAARIKPDESYPDTRIAEIEKLLAELNAAKEQQASLASSEEERRRIEKEYNEHIQAADKLYKDSKQKDVAQLESAKNEYNAALGLKNGEKYPKAQITSIDNLIASLNNKNNNDLAAEAERLEKERLQQEEEMRRQKEDQQSIAEQQRQKRIADEEEKRKQRDAALAASKEAEENRGKFRTTDRSKEDEVDAYYREAKEIEEAAKCEAMKEKKEVYDNYYVKRDIEAGLAIKERVDNINGQKESLQHMDEAGNTLTAKSTSELEALKEQDNTNNKKYIDRAGTKEKDAIRKAQEQKESQDGLLTLDRNRQKLIEDTKQKNEIYSEKQKTIESRGETARSNKGLEVDRNKENQKQMAFDGEKVRQENIQAATNKKEDAANYDKDTQSAAQVRLGSAQALKTEEKRKADEYGKGKETLTTDNIITVNKMKQDNEMAVLENDTESSEKRYEARQALMDKNPGREKEDDEYKEVPGTEELPEGVSETSYEYGKNKKVIERTVKRGNKVDTYRKVVSKTGIYYFKNNKSITEQMWIQETLQSRE